MTFGWRNGPDRVQFIWLGTKHDFYRASMGVRLDQTLESLCRADPNLEAGGAVREREAETITFRLNFTGTPPPLEPILTRAEPKPVRAGTPAVAPPGAGREVEGTPRTDARPSIAVVESSPGIPPPPPAAAPKPGVASTEAWDAAREEGSLRAFVRFLQDHPEASQAPEARRRADALREAKAYRRALEADEPQVYRGFLEQFSASAHRKEVKTRLEALEESRRQAEVERRIREVLAKQRRVAYAESRRLDTPEAYRMFLTTYPDSPEAPEVRRRTLQAEADDRAFRTAGDTLEGLGSYLATLPGGRHATEARSRIQHLRRQRAESDFGAARRAGTVEAMEAFLEAWPDGPRAREARASLTSLASSNPPPPTAHGSGMVLEARKVDATPTVDGDPGDAVWREVTLTVVPVRSGERVFDLELRAAHTETQVFLIAQWHDDTEDTRYRPWKWSAEAQTYRQVTDLDDALAVALYPPGGDPAACMLAGRPVNADVWMWRAQWSDLSGLALDGRMQVSPARLPRSNPYPARDGSGQLWLRQPPDTGTSGWSFYIPMEYQGDVVDSYRPTRATGSRADVRARGRWDAGIWTVEFARALDTRHEDDVRMGPGGVWSIAFAVYDRAEKQDHASSDLVRLRLRGR